MKQCKHFVILAAFALPLNLLAQDAGKDPDVPAPPTSKEHRKKAKKKWKEQREQDMLIKRNYKQHHKRLQDKKTYRRMKKDKRKANRINQNKKELFFIRWFQLKPKV